MARLGLIAGNGQFPLIFCAAARAEGVEVVVVAHQGETPQAISDHASRVTLGPGRGTRKNYYDLPRGWGDRSRHGRRHL